MSTKVSILDEKSEPKKKPIEFKRLLGSSLVFFNSRGVPSDYENIILIARQYNYSEEKLKQNPDYLDLMFAFDEERDNGVLYLGYFNDGTVE